MVNNMIDGVYLIAEIGINHEGNIDIAFEMIKQAKWAGANAVKFQYFKPDRLFAPYKDKKFSGKNIINFFKKYEFGIEEFRRLKKYSDDLKIDFLVTPFFIEAVDELERLKLQAYKVASYELWHLPLLERIKKTNKRVFLSIGMADEGEIFKVFNFFGKDYPLTLLHCVSLYPPESHELNLNVIKRLKSLFPYEVGYSDHYPDYFSAIIAVAKGASVIEKHFTLDNSKEGADHKISLTPLQFKEMFSKINLLKDMEGSEYKIRKGREEEAYLYGRRSIFAIKDIKKGERITKEKVDFLRPGVGISPWEWYKIENTIVNRNIKAYEPLKWEYINL